MKYFLDFGLYLSLSLTLCMKPSSLLSSLRKLIRHLSLPIFVFFPTSLYMFSFLLLFWPIFSFARSGLFQYILFWWVAQISAPGIVLKVFVSKWLRVCGDGLVAALYQFHYDKSGHRKLFGPVYAIYMICMMNEIETHVYHYSLVINYSVLHSSSTSSPLSIRVGLSSNVPVRWNASTARQSRQKPFTVRQFHYFILRRCKGACGTLHFPSTRVARLNTWALIN